MNINKVLKIIFAFFPVLIVGNIFSDSIPYSYTITDTDQKKCYDNFKEIDCPEPGEKFYGQDAQYTGYESKFNDNGDGTVSDLTTGLMWIKSPDWDKNGIINYNDKMSYNEAIEYVKKLNKEDYLGYNDWRLPTIKELYSLIKFSGVDPSGYDGNDTSKLTPFIDTNYFDFAYGDINSNERIIDAQYLSSTKYVSTTMKDAETVFGVNFADGRIKGYPTGPMPGRKEDKQFYVIYVRGNPEYGKNNFVDNNDGTIIDNATGLMWSKNDSGVAMTWEEALEWVQEKNEENYLGYNDWRLPNAKELQSIVDYTKSPDTSNSAAIDSVFQCTTITNEENKEDYGYYWTSTTHVSLHGAQNAVYISFGRALGWMTDRFGNKEIMDVHGAGAQRSDPKIGNPDNFEYGRGPQGDVIRIYNFVRLVRDVSEKQNNVYSEKNISSNSEETMVKNEENKKEGYILFSPLSSTKTFLINKEKEIVHSWDSEYYPGQNTYLLENGHILRTGKVRNLTFEHGGGLGGIIQEFDWDGNLVWEFKYSSKNFSAHHDIEPLPNGNILIIAWELKSKKEAIEKGIDPKYITDNGIWSESIIEIKPKGKNDAEIVWKWSAWDHIIQNYDSNKPNYGEIKDHPEKININYKTLGNKNDPDWLHINYVDYNPELDQILLTVHNFSEIWVIDHSTTTQEAKTDNGGKYGKGGDILYRWGNPAAYDFGNKNDQILFGPHNAHWIPNEFSNYGNILIFNNGQGRTNGNFSEIIEITPYLNLNNIDNNFYKNVEETKISWKYISKYYSDRISGAVRLPNGNTLICYGPQGIFEEITYNGEIIWSYTNPFGEKIDTPNKNNGIKNAVFTINWYNNDYSPFLKK
ncbi:DUF1566 domain-containing protein [Marinitoga sp. 38H-ov]|uniref:Lcl domain-containing protein n=1 Tax=Marinitoga sp. 38H-ov TaxID=1755814 RepID=UPI0013ED4A0C|nr:DUF1566 domain-containing protein [Marinitoga sp. 38H-ov]